MDCPFCESKTKCTNLEEIVNHIIITEESTGEVHVHGPIHDKNIIGHLVGVLLKESRINEYTYNNGKGKWSK